MLKPLLLVFLLLLSACGSSEDKSAPPKSQQGREETKNIRNTEAIGYSGNAIGNKVDNALNASDERQKKLDEAVGEPAK